MEDITTFQRAGECYIIQACVKQMNNYSEQCARRKENELEKVSAVMLVAVMTASLAACGGSGSDSKDSAGKQESQDTGKALYSSNLGQQPGTGTS